jgi:hypothetical protein
MSETNEPEVVETPPEFVPDPITEEVPVVGAEPEEVPALEEEPDEIA